MKLLWMVIGLSFFVSASFAETPFQLYEDGKFAEAERAALADGGAAGYTLAARADLAAEMMRAEPCKSCLQHALELAQHAVDLDPKLSEGRVEFVVALGYQARLIGMFEAHFKGFAQKAKTNIDAAIAADPNNAWAWAALGGWNIEIAHDAGSALARWLFGASLKTGFEDFSKAFAAAPDNLVIRYQYALTLGGCHEAAFHDTILSALSHAVAATPHGVYEAYAQKCSRELLAALKAGDMDTFDKLVRHDQGYPS
jgi:tetratricopeptide (TPR) repeat protein